MIKCFVLSYLFCMATMAFADSTMVPAGTVNGTWTAPFSPYIVWEGDISVSDGDTLRIQPGVVIRFTGAYKLRVSGVLRALGRPDSLIYFTADTLSNPAGWGGIRFASSRDSSCLSYCVVENGRANGVWPDYAGGGVAQVGSRRITLTNVTLRYNRANPTGGAYLGSGSGGALFTQCNFTLNAATVDGGAVYLNSGSPNTFVGCNFISNSAGLSNSAGYDGGAVNTYHALGTFTACRFAQNHCGSDGGAVQGHGTLTFTNCVFDTNLAGNNGGGLYLDDSLSTFTMTGCTVRGNSAGHFGGGLYAFDSSPTVTNSQFIGNYAADRGGGINCYRWSITAHFENCLITQNACGSQGGGLWVATYCHPTFRNCTFSWNTARTGAALYSTNHGAPSFDRCSFVHNTALEDGGAISLNQNSNFVLDSSSLRWNTAGGPGGGLSVYGSFFSITACSLSYNSARDGGAAAIFESCAQANPVLLSGSLISGNHADSLGGGIYVQGSSCTDLEQLIIVDNQAGYAGGGIACTGGASPGIRRCDVMRNQAAHGAGIYSDGSAPVISTDIIAANVGRGAELLYSTSALLRYCDFYSNSTGNISGNSLPIGIGVEDRFNANGTPCDIYSNVFANPSLPDTASGNYRLAGGSPCLDAGDSALSCDPDMTIPDIGAFPTLHSISTLAPRALAMYGTDSRMNLRWRRPLHFCARAPIRYEVWSADRPDSLFQLVGTTLDTLYTDSLTIRSDSCRIYQVIWRQVSE